MSHRTADELQELNLSYLLLVQKMLIEDREATIFRLKLSEDMANVLSGLSIREMTWLASQGQFLLCPNLGEAEQLQAILQNKRDTGLQQTHLAMLVTSAS